MLYYIGGILKVLTQFFQNSIFHLNIRDALWKDLKKRPIYRFRAPAYSTEYRLGYPLRTSRFLIVLSPPIAGPPRYYYVSENREERR